MLDVDLTRPEARVRVVVEGVRAQRGVAWADARTVDDWCQRYHAFGGVNGGYFGAESGKRKEIIGLLATDGVVRSPGRLVRARGNTDRFARSALLVGRDGLPHIGWATAERGRRALVAVHDQPVNPSRQQYRRVASAVACGPTLIHAGAACVTDHEERLVSPRRVPRTFVAYSVAAGKPRFFVMGVATAMTYRDVAAFLQRYFVREHQAACEAAMCLDGGASSQLAYLSGGRYVCAPDSDVTVPTAVLVAPPPR